MEKYEIHDGDIRLERFLDGFMRDISYARIGNIYIKIPSYFYGLYETVHGMYTLQSCQTVYLITTVHNHVLKKMRLSLRLSCEKSVIICSIF